MTAGPREVRWDTPMSDARSLVMVSLLDRSGLHVTLQDLRDPARRRYRFSFRRAPAYRNILEEYQPDQPAPPEGIGWTRRVLDSVWLRELREQAPLFEVFSPGCVHYVIVTEDDVVEVLSAEPPVIHEIEPAGEFEEPAGKSRVLRHPEDREAIDELIRDLGRREGL